MSEMKKRWIALYVENQVGVLAKVSGLFSGKSYNLQSLTVGTTEDESVSRMTISVASDDITFEQIKKQLNRMVEVIKVIDLTDVPLRLKELMFVKIMDINETQMTEVFQIAQAMRCLLYTSMYDLCMRCELIQITSNAIVKTGSDGKKHITLCNCNIRRIFSMHSTVSDIKRMCRRNCAFSHNCCYNRYIFLFHKFL